MTAVSIRKIRLLCAAYCRPVWHLLIDERYRNAIIDVENNPERIFRTERKGFIRGWTFELQAIAVKRDKKNIPELERWSAKAQYEAAMAAWKSLADEADEEARKQPLYCWDLSTSKALTDVGRHAADAARYEAMSRGLSGPRANKESRAHQRRLKVCVCGSRSHSTSMNPTWLTSSAVGLLEAIENERAFDLMPILADALEESGCDNIDMLLHCRSGEPHVRGCWVIDLLKGK